MAYIGDFAEDYATLNTKFTTRTVAGVPSTFGGTPAISVYKANGATQSTAGITLSADFDSVTGLNNVLIDLSADAFYAIANDYQIVITTGTVNSVSVVGEVVGEFSIENRFDHDTATATALATAQTDLDTITGADGTTLATSQGNYAPATVAALAVVDTNVDQIETAVITNAAGADIAADIIAVKAETALIVADTNELQTDDVPGLIAALNDISVANILTTQMTEAYAADGSAPTVAQALMMIQQTLGEFSISGTTLTVKKVDGSTTAATFTLDDGTNPTSLTRAT